MNRLQRECLVASAGFHLLLVFLLLIGSAFRAPDGKRGDPAPPIQLVTAPQSELAATAALPPRNGMQPGVMPGAVGEIKQPITARNLPESISDRRPTKLQISTNVVIRNLAATATASRPAPRSQPVAGDPRVEQVDRVLAGILSGLSPATPIDTNIGSGRDDQARAYEQLVKEAYTRSWIPLESEVTDEETVTKVTVTIGSEGKVLSRRVIKSSGVAAMDKSVQRALEQVKFIEPFEPGAREKERTYTINFDLRAKRLL
jgi:TonB family protein